MFIDAYTCTHAHTHTNTHTHTRIGMSGVDVWAQQQEVPAFNYPYPKHPTRSSELNIKNLVAEWIHFFLG